MQHLTATYSPDDNKLRLYSLSRLDADTYERVKHYGFRWAPKQDLFFATWTPSAAELLTELCGEIGDEDKTLAERADERAERFSEYQGNRASDAESARNAVASIADNIPLGQPILVGHHSERRARKDAERIENGMRKAVKMWETSEYWGRRAKAARAHAAYKETPAVRARRIKKLEAELRRQQRRIDDAKARTSLWQNPNMTFEKARDLSGYDSITVRREGEKTPTTLWSELSKTDPELTLEQAVELAVKQHARVIAYAQTWADHFSFRLVYERAMLEESGGMVASKFNIEVGGQVLIRGEWNRVLRVNRSDGIVRSVRTDARFLPVRNVEEINDYQAPSEHEAATVKAATKLPPLCNYPGEGFMHMTSAEWKAINKDYKAVRVAPATETVGAHRHRRAMTKECRLNTVFITDAKRIDPPSVQEGSARLDSLPAAPSVTVEAAPIRQQSEDPQAAAFKAMSQQLKDGIKVVSAPQLFPTPASLAERMEELAEIETGQRILEPSAGTGRILHAVHQSHGQDITYTAVEISPSLCALLRNVAPYAELHEGDFIDRAASLGKFDRILMNPPFVNASDIVHIKAALSLLSPGGRIVAVCANGPRQNRELRPIVESMGGSWEVLPADTFKESGTLVSSVLLSFTV